MWSCKKWIGRNSRPLFQFVKIKSWDPAKQMTELNAMTILKDRTHNGAIVLLHSVSTTNAAILGKYIGWLTSQRYSFGSLNEL